MEGIAPL